MQRNVRCATALKVKERLAELRHRSGMLVISNKYAL